LGWLVFGAICSQCLHQASRSCANLSNSSNELVGGASAHMFPRHPCPVPT
jgi:hypothetical protein